MIGIKVSKPGKDISSAIPDDFYMHSDYPLLKVHTFGTFSFAVALEGTTITHNLGYHPYVIVFSQAVSADYAGNVSTNYLQMPWAISGATRFWRGLANVTTTTIEITVTDTDVATGGTVNGFYYIFADRMDTL